MDTLNLRACLAWRAVALAAMVALGGALSTAPAWAAPAPAHHAQATTSAKYLNGGFGEESQKSMQSQARDWPLRLTFSEHADGAFVADVSLRVMDHAGHDVLQLANAGPMTYVRVPNGQYRLVATYKGKELTRNADVTRGGTNVNFNWR